MTSIPVGTIMAFGGDVNDPAIASALLAQGWLPCWGQSVSAATYQDLDDAINTTYGGTGANFALPDLRGRFVRGAHNKPGSPVAFSVGQVLTSLTAQPQSGQFSLDAGGSHSHAAPSVPGWSNSSSYCAGYDNAQWNDGSVATSSNGAHTHTVTTGGDSESRPVNLYVEYIIKVLDVDSEAS